MDDTLGNLILLSDETDNNYLDDIGTTCVLTFIDTDTGQSSSRTFTLLEGEAINPAVDKCHSSRLPFNTDLTKLAIVSDPQPPSTPDYYRSAGYVEADGGYVEVTTAESSFGGEGGYFAATFQDDLLLVLTRNNEWVDPVSQEVKFPGPKGLDDWDRRSLYLSGTTPTDYSSVSGGCMVPSRAGSECYNSTVGGDIVAGGDVIWENANCTLIAVDSKDNFYCAEELSNGQEQLVRIDRSTGEVLPLTPATDQEFLQAVVSSNEEQVLFTARREGDPIAAYAVSAAGGTEPRELSVLTGELSEEDELYSWTAAQNQDQEPVSEGATSPGTREDTEMTSSNENENLTDESTAEGTDEEVSLDQAVGDYYRAAGVQDWEYTYDNLDSQTQSMFTQEEWSQKNQWFWDLNSTVYHILSIESDGDSEGSVAEVELRITGEDGSSWTRLTYFVKEDGEWLHRFSEEETDLFMPGATFEEFVEAHTDASS